MKRRVFSTILAAIFIFMALPVFSLAAETAVCVNGVKLNDGEYWKNGDTTTATGTADDYNAYYNSQAATLVLRDAVITSGYYDSENDVFAGIYADVDNFAIVFGGNNKIDLSSIAHTNVYGVYSKKTISMRDGSLDIDIKSDKAEVATGIFSGVDFFPSNVKLDIDVTSEEAAAGIYASGNVLAYNGSDFEVNADNIGINAENITLENGKYTFNTDEYGINSRNNLTLLNDADVIVNVSAEHSKAIGVKFVSKLEMLFESVLYSNVIVDGNYNANDYVAVVADENAECVVGGVVLPIGGSIKTVNGIKTVVTSNSEIATEAKLTAELCNAAIQTEPTVVELELGCEPVTVEVKNVGNVDLELIQPTSQYYEVGTLSKIKLAPGETSTFTVGPINDADSFENIEIKTNYGTSTSVQVTYTVVNDHDPDHAGDDEENTELPTQPDTTDPDSNSTTENNSATTSPDNNSHQNNTTVKTGITHNWVLPVVLICVAALIIVLLLVTKKKKADK